MSWVLGGSQELFAEIMSWNQQYFEANRKRWSKLRLLEFAAPELCWANATSSRHTGLHSAESPVVILICSTQFEDLAKITVPCSWAVGKIKWDHHLKHLI